MEIYMELFQSRALRRLFDNISGFIPNNIEEFNKITGEAVSDISHIYDITRVEYTFSPPSGTSFVKLPPQHAVLFENDNNSSGEKTLFSYSFEKDGVIEFSVFFKNGKCPADGGQWCLEIIFRQFYYVLNSLIMSLFCKKLTLTDYGTGIANLNAFLQFGDKLIARGEIEKYTALYFNIHNFKSVHKSLTYMEANKVMEKYCDIVSNAVTKHEIVARMGSDNFAALIFTANKDYFFDLIQNMVVKHEKDGQKLSFLFGATIGAASLSAKTSTGDIMMHISTAYQSARDKRSLFSYYDKNTSLEILERTIILSKFSKAISNKEFFAVYQPKVDVKTRAIIGAEALARWNHSGGCIMPASFIPVFENDGCITALDFYMLEEVCKLLNKLRLEGMDLIKISVNFSKRHLSNNRLVEEIVEVIDRYEIPHKYIEIELTESENYHNQEIMVGIVNDLNALGINTSIDDFGTGYSSLSLLNTLHLDTLKIDRSFIPQSKTDINSKSMLMLSGVINLAKSLGCTVVAEGVETTEQLELIESMDCDIVQGFLFDKPLPENEFIERIKRKFYIPEKQ